MFLTYLEKFFIIVHRLVLVLCQNNAEVLVMGIELNMILLNCSFFFGVNSFPPDLQACVCGGRGGAALFPGTLRATCGKREGFTQG